MASPFLIMLLFNTMCASLMPNTLRFYYPIPKFPSVSITGTHCELQCSHCKGHYLKHMPDVSTPKKLREFCITHEGNGGVGLLISGGSTKEGKIPLEPYLNTIRWIKDNTHLILNLHTGMLNKSEAEKISATGVDMVSVDLVGSDDTLKEVYGLQTGAKEYNATLRYLVDFGANVAPHICIGLHYGEVKGERYALELAAEAESEVVILISLIPTSDTPMEKAKPPSIESITKVISEAKEVCKTSEIGLGCMRYRGYKTDLEWAAIKSGVSRIALASKSTERRATEAGYRVKKLNGCCSTPKNFDPFLL
jgi:uncharacterized radical SAM superfamily protein